MSTIVVVLNIPVCWYLTRLTVAVDYTHNIHIVTYYSWCDAVFDDNLKQIIGRYSVYLACVPETAEWQCAPHRVARAACRATSRHRWQNPSSSSVIYRASAEYCRVTECQVAYRATRLQPRLLGRYLSTYVSPLSRDSRLATDRLKGNNLLVTTILTLR